MRSGGAGAEASVIQAVGIKPATAWIVIINPRVIWVCLKQALSMRYENIY